MEPEQAKSLLEFTLGQLSLFGAYSLVNLCLCFMIWYLMKIIKSKDMVIETKDRVIREMADERLKDKEKHLVLLGNLKEPLTVIAERLNK